MRNHTPLTREERCALAGITLVLLWPAWLRGGTVPYLMAPLPWIALLALVAWIVIRGRAVDGMRMMPLRDPLLYIGILFLALLGTQWWNAGRALILDADSASWVYTTPRVPWLPSAINAGDAREMFSWFCPAFVAVWLTRWGLRRRRAVMALFWVLAGNAGLLAVAGLYFAATDSGKILGLHAARAHFFASFGYANHAGAYFLIMLTLATGLFLEGGRVRGHYASAPGMVAVGIALLCLTAIHLSLSRACMLLSWVFCVFLFCHLYRRVLTRVSPAKRFHVLLILAALVGLSFFLVSGLGRGAVRSELETLRLPRVVNSLTRGRWFQVETALHIWKDYPLFGVGGWGYRYMTSLYLPHEDWARITHDGEDQTISANVHNDTAQFLAEFGAVGFGLLLAGVLCMALPLARKADWSRPVVLLPAAGLGLVVLHSFIDLPFRSPAILYTWLVLLAGSERLVVLMASGYDTRSSG